MIDESIVEISEKLLQSLGYRITGMTRSVGALDTFQKAPDDFDLIITDVTIPSMTGVDLVRNTLLVRRDIPIIICTGFSEVMNTKKAMETGASDYLMKPITRADLAYGVRKGFDAIGGG